MSHKPLPCSFNILYTGAGELAQQWRALAALGEDLGPIPSTHMVAHKAPELYRSSGTNILF